MALFRGTIRSQVLRMDTNVNVVIPEAHYQQPLAPNKTLILLHGLIQNADAWVRMSCAETYAHTANFNLIIPEVQRSFYTDMAYGLDYFTYITDELPKAIGSMFRIPVDRDHLYVAGLSMGGFGAMKCALTYPDRFAGAMSFSGAVYRMEDLSGSDMMTKEEMQAILGMDLKVGRENDLRQLMRSTAEAAQQPKLYLACGTEDFLIGMNRAFAADARALHLDLTYEEWGGIHDWFFWDRALARGMAVMTGLNVNDISTTDTQPIGSLG